MKKTLIVLASVFFTFLFLPKNAIAYESPIFERISDSAVKFTVSNFQSNNFIPALPATCYYPGLFQPDWHFWFRAVSEDGTQSDVIETAQTNGQIPGVFEYTFDAQQIPNNRYQVSDPRLYQRCSDGTEHFAPLGFNIQLYFSVYIASDRGFLEVAKGDDLDISAGARGYDGVTDSQIQWEWDLDNDGIFTDDGPIPAFHSQDKPIGPNRIQVKGTLPGGFSDIGEYFVNVLDLPSTIEYVHEFKTPDYLAQGAEGFINPENTLAEDGATAVQDDNPDVFSINYGFNNNLVPGYRIKSLILHLKVKNSGSDAAKPILSVGTNAHGFSNENCPLIKTGSSIIEHECSLYFSDWNDAVNEINEVDLNFDSYENRNENIEIDYAFVEYVYKKIEINDMAIDAGGPYVGLPDQQINLSASGSGHGSEDYEYNWDLNGDGVYETNGADATFDSMGLSPGIYTAVAQAKHPIGATATNSASIIISDEEGPSDPITLFPIADSFIKQGGQNENEGGSPMMRLQSSGKNRGLVQFSQEEIDQAIGESENYTAKLQFTITDNGNNWGTNGRTVDIHRLTNPWIEGNGYLVGNQPTFRGTGAGATWNCGIDNNTANQTDDCSSTWNMTNSSSWPFVTSPAATTTIINNQSGVVEFDITGDIQEFINGADNFGWVVKKTDEGANGRVEFGSRETSNPPTLVITFN